LEALEQCAFEVMASTGKKRKANEHETATLHEEGKEATTLEKTTAQSAKGSAGTAASLPKKKPRLRKVIKNKQVVENIRVMFEEQAELWKRHANLIDTATTRTLSVSSVVQHQPWSSLLNNGSTLPPQEQLEPNRAVDLNQSLDNILTRTRQAFPTVKRKSRARMIERG
jgi:hypothetical protein